MDILQVLEGLAYVGFIAGAIFAVIELRSMSRDRRSQAVVEVFTRTSSPDFTGAVMKIAGSEFKDANDAMEKCTEDSLMMVGHYFEGLGLLFARGLVDDDLIMEVWPYKLVWDKMKPYTNYLRERHGPWVWEWFEYLGNEQDKYDSRREERRLSSRFASAG